MPMAGLPIALRRSALLPDLLFIESVEDAQTNDVKKLLW